MHMKSSQISNESNTNGLKLKHQSVLIVKNKIMSTLDRVSCFSFHCFQIFTLMRHLKVVCHAVFLIEGKRERRKDGGIGKKGTKESNIKITWLLSGEIKGWRVIHCLH